MLRCSCPASRALPALWARRNLSPRATSAASGARARALARLGSKAEVRWRQQREAGRLVCSGRGLRISRRPPSPSPAIHREDAAAGRGGAGGRSHGRRPRACGAPSAKAARRRSRHVAFTTRAGDARAAAGRAPEPSGRPKADLPRPVPPGRAGLVRSPAEPQGGAAPAPDGLSLRRRRLPLARHAAETPGDFGWTLGFNKPWRGRHGTDILTSRSLEGRAPQNPSWPGKSTLTRHTHVSLHHRLTR